LHNLGDAIAGIDDRKLAFVITAIRHAANRRRDLLRAM
jgi:hypothetical protein